MSTIVERLRGLAPDEDDMPVTRRAMLEAATALEAKDKELAALRGGLEIYASLAMKEGGMRTAWQARAETAERERDHFKGKAHEYFGMYDEALRERDEAREALKPFAAQAECWPEIPDNQAMMTSNGEDLSSLDFLMSDLRAALAITGESRDQGHRTSGAERSA